MLDRFAERLRASAALRHLLFFAASLLAILIIGYHFGTFDQTVHIPFLEKTADPSLYPGDAFMEMRFQHYSFFWFLFIPFARPGLLESLLFSLHFAATYLTFWAVWELALTLFGDPLAGLIAVAAFIVPHVGFSAFPIFEFSLLNRTAMLPFVLFSLNLYLRGRCLAAFGLLGVVANFHILSAGYALGLLLLDLGVRFLRAGWRDRWALARTGGLCLALFAAAALPVLAWRAVSPPVQLTPDPDWFSIISLGAFYHLFYLIAPYPHILLVTASGTAGLVLYGIARRQRLSPEHDSTLDHFILAAMLFVLGQAVLTLAWPITFIAQAQVMRAGMLALLLGDLYFAGYLARRYRTGSLRGADFGWLAASFVGGLLAVLPLLTWLGQRLLGGTRWRHAASALLFAGFYAVSLPLALPWGIWSPGIYVTMRPTAWHAAQVWARDNTPKDAVFITPLHLWWFYDADWRVFSERAQVVSFSDLLEIALVPDYLPTWRLRFEALAPGVISRFRGDYFENRRLTAEAFRGLSTTDLLRAACDYGATYLVVEKPYLHPLAVVYENEQFVIYSMPPLEACGSTGGG